MAKDTSRPKAINIIRPNHSLSTTANNKRSTPTPPLKPHISSSSNARKPKVTTSAKISFDHGIGASGSKPQLNIYRPPSRSPQGPQVLAPQPRVSVTTTPNSNRGIGGNVVHSQRTKASLQQEAVPRSLTTPILASNSTPVSIADRFQRRTTPTPPSPQQQQQQHLGETSSPPSLSSQPSLMTRSRTLHTVNAVLTTTSDEESETDEEEDVDPNESASSSSTNDDEEDEDDPMINEARVNRKIADLEISNRSLLAVNELLEITVRRQASQVAKLKKQLANEGPLDIKPLPLPSTTTEEDQEGDDNDDDDDDWEKDPTFHRMYQLTESMIQLGQESLRFQYKGARVLSHYNQDEEDEEEQVEDNDCEPSTRPPATNQQVDQSTKQHSNNVHSPWQPK